MKFNVTKCKVMHVGTNNAGASYFMNGQLLDEVSTYKDLGVSVSSDLKVAYNKANKMLGLVKRTIKHINMDMIQLYKSLVRPHLEYCSPAWSPHYVKDKALVEKVQHRYTRVFPDLRTMKYEARLEVLRLWSLEERRNRADLIEVYKMVNGLSSVPVTAFFQLATNSCTRGHSRKLVKAHCRSDIRLYFFSPRLLNRWNSLSQDTVDACSVNAFKWHLDKIRLNKMGYFMDSWSA